ncbi:nuclear transport factor 2 family protein [Terricaulis silvestris]|uniref:SnoaL-like domain-containing protein n=1 Tax=Terricaulis silvestris TaxID=2686094 RepID=A0A6I6MHA2_9CAUL|nr:nuclear transport factor 2 family protein [Terricaulis silvestris]QGZ93769.1 hypothetical protein DSM104635_00582 [Terricaulis silvestris]
MATEEHSALQQLLDKEAIRECLMRYSRGMDRRDRAILATAYWPEAIDNHLSFSGPVSDFFDFSLALTADMRTHHMLGNILVEFASPSAAHAETYYIAAHERTVVTGREDFIIHGRYLDRFEKRGEEWRIIERTLTCDMYSMRPSTADWVNGPYAKIKTQGGSVPEDPLYWVFADKP